MKQSTYLRKVLNALVDAGYTITGVDDGGDEKIAVGGIMDTMTAVKAVDEAYVFVAKGEEESWLRIIWQGPDATYQEGEEIISDYGVSLSPVLEKIENAAT